MEIGVNTQGTNGGSVTDALPENEPSYVYMLYSAGKIKIGTSFDPLQRIDKLKTANAEPVFLVWIGFGDRRTEDHLHGLFKRDRMHGEWFRLSDEIRDFIVASSTELSPFAGMLRNAENASVSPFAGGVR